MFNVIYLFLHVLMGLVVAEAGWRNMFWFEKRVGKDLRLMMLGIIIMALSLEAWDVALIVSGLNHRLLSFPLSVCIDTGLLLGFSLILFSTWFIDFKLEPWRLVLCALGRCALAVVITAFLVTIGIVG